MTILRSCIKGFDVANPASTYTGPDTATNIRGLTATQQEREAWKNPIHPTNKHLKLVDSYPLLPDLDGFTEDSQGGYAVLKFIGNPTDTNSRPDGRLETAILRSLDVDEAVVAEFQQRVAAHKANPELHSAPSLPTVNYELFLPADESMSRGIKRKRDVDDAERDDAELYTDVYDPDGTENDCFKLNNVRAYESGMQQTFADGQWQEVAIALHDGGDGVKEEGRGGAENTNGEGTANKKQGRRQKAAYFYPVSAKTQLKPRRAAQLAQIGLAARRKEEEPEEKIDVLALQYRDQNEEEREARAEIVAGLEGRPAQVQVEG